jgi:hypothetical protein
MSIKSRKPGELKEEIRKLEDSKKDALKPAEPKKVAPKRAK